METNELNFNIEKVATDRGPALFVSFELIGEVATPEGCANDIHNLKLVQDEPGLGVIFSGRGPIWVYAMLCHLAHPFAWVATWEPRMNAGVVVQSHWPGVKVGELILRQLN